MKAAVIASYYCPQCRTQMNCAFPFDSDVPIHWCVTENCRQYGIRYRASVVELEPVE